jgi:formate--tetrahydrofolate ligase
MRAASAPEKKHMIDESLRGICAKLDIPEAATDPRGKQFVKIDPTRVDGDKKGRVVLVTAMTPTPAGEGKTTTSIGLVDGLNRLGVNAVGALREPSLGPLFGLKGGAIGGGESKVVPADQINMHFTGDLHAVTSAHNLLSALVDNHMYFQNEPKLDPENVTWGRVLDMNDRALRRVEVGSSTKKGPIRIDRFDITAASEVMAILCLSSDPADLKKRLANITVGMSVDGKRVTAGDLGAEGAMAAILLDAVRPNLVRTLEDNPVFVHGGPFANIAQGTSTLIQTKLCQRLADVTVTEGGFAFDLGGFKFIDIKCRAGGMKPAAVVLVVTVRALRHHGGADFSAGPDVGAVEKGLANVEAHLAAMERMGLPKPLVSINRFPDDSADELATIKSFVESKGATCVEGDYFARGGEGAEDLARALMEQLEGAKEDSPDYKLTYEVGEDYPTKIEKICKTVFGADGIELSDGAKADLDRLEKLGLDGLPVVLAKTHLSISDDKKALGKPEGFNVTVTGLRPSSGAGFIVALCGKILTMPGLPKKPAADGVDIVQHDDGSWDITGLR